MINTNKFILNKNILNNNLMKFNLYAMKIIGFLIFSNAKYPKFYDYCGILLSVKFVLFNLTQVNFFIF